MEGFKEENDVSTAGQLDSPAVGSLQQCEHYIKCNNLSEDNELSVYGAAGKLENNEFKVEDVAGTLENHDYGMENAAGTSEDDESTADDTAFTMGPKIVCVISEFHDQQPTATTLTSVDYKILNELTEDLLMAAVRKSLNVPPISLRLNDEQFSSMRDDSRVALSKNNKPWIIIRRVLDKLVEFEEVSTGIRNSNMDYGKHRPPLPSCLRSAPEVEHLSPIPPHTHDCDCVAPADHLAYNEQHLTTAGSQRQSDGDSEPDVLEVKSLMFTEKSIKFEKLNSEAIEVDCKCLLEQHSPVTQLVEEQTQSQVCETSAIDISTIVESAVTEQIHTPERIQILDSVLSNDNVVVPEEAAKSTDIEIESIAVAKSDGDELERTQVESKYAELQRKDRRRSFMSALGKRFLKVGRMLCCCSCRNSNN